MEIISMLQKEWAGLMAYSKRAVSISTTAKSTSDFKVLPRRNANDTAMACFLINSKECLQDTIDFFDGKVDSFYVDVEAKQEINLFHLAKEQIKQSNLYALKPNDITVEACDFILRDYFNDDLDGKTILVIGTGNLASKIALRATERRATVVVDGRTASKLHQLVSTLNTITPTYSPRILTLKEWYDEEKDVDAVVSFLSGTYWQEEQLKSILTKQTFFIDGGINNFTKDFIHYLMELEVRITRLDVRLALLYQFIFHMKDTRDFLDNVYGVSEIEGVQVVSGGFIAEEGTVIVDQIKCPSQIIGVTDGKGGVKLSSSLSDADQQHIHKVKAVIDENQQNLQDGRG